MNYIPWGCKESDTKVTKQQQQQPVVDAMCTACFPLNLDTISQTIQQINPSQNLQNL